MTTPGNDGHTIVIVEDNAQVLGLIAKSLQMLGNYTVITASDGVAGLEMVVQHRPQCVVIDVLMPGLDGYQLVRAIRGDPDTATIPLVILTAMAQDRDRYTGLASGVDIYLTKPIDPADLVAVIHKAVTLGEEERLERLRMLVEEWP